MIVIWSTPKKFHLFSWLISKFLGAKYSHSAIVFKIEQTGQFLVFQATRKGVYPIEYSKFKAKNHIIEYVEINQDHLEEYALRYCIDHIGTQYDFLDVILIALNIKYSNGEKRMICSELVARAIGFNGHHLDQIDPKELKELIKEIPC